MIRFTKYVLSSIKYLEECYFLYQNITDSIVRLYETFDEGLSWDEVIIAPGDEYLSDITCTNNNCFVTGDALYRKFDPTTSIQEMELEKINISPNSAANYLHIESTDLEADEVEVLDIYGRFRKRYMLSSNKITINDLPKGLYILRIEFEGGEKLMKFEKI